MTPPVFDDWHSPANHIAVNPSQPDAATGLADFLTSQSLTHLCLFQTSGSTGTPKWVALTKSAFLISAQAVNTHFEVTTDDHWLIALPLHHVGGFSILARAHLSHSRVTQTTAKWQPQDFATLCEKERITLVSLVPAQVHDLVQARIPCPDTLRAAIIGGGAMSQSLADSALALGWRVFQTYGMTEAASQIATQPYNPFGPVFDVQSLEVLPHWQVSTSDSPLNSCLDPSLDALDRPLDPNLDKGSPLILSGPALSPGYALRTADGTWHWDPIPPTGLVTRDLVRLWNHGTHQFLQFTGRDSGYIKILGELIHLAPLQEQIETLARQQGWPTPPGRVGGGGRRTWWFLSRLWKEVASLGFTRAGVSRPDRAL
ncbi:AMP-binding protein [Prosthecobacter sp. SYSU 5D2]|uniref:AMP-binding protein n=1 Tax=Prosthecobacter sp. SYSU 5D2 TaxID=3134134 RepID=UPI0031FF20A7